jgi:pyruvate dehydrogenase E2 component (dihydrolipoamide acetyltransferase)
MATEVTMPKLGLTMVDGKIVEWRKNEGEVVEKGKILFVIETEKVTYEVEAPTSGILGNIVVPVGETVPVGTVVAYILQPGEILAEVPAKEKAAKTPVTAVVPEVVFAIPTPREEAAITGVSTGRVKISPVARKLAEEHGIDISQVMGSGPDGRIVKEDIMKAVEEAKSKPAIARPAAEEILPTRAKLLPLSGMRRTIARRISQSFQTAPHFWIQAKVDATKLKEAREQLLPSIEKETGQRLTYTDLIVKIVARVLEDYPIFNSRWTDNGIELLEDINIGVATSVPDGLIVPVLRQVNIKSLTEITRTRADIVSRGREGKLGIDEMTGSTITITNLGVASGGIIGGNPILNPPEVAIIALGPIAEEPAVVDGQVVPRLCLNLTLAIDHRVLDGFIAAQFLGRIKELIEQPLLLL